MITFLAIPSRSIDPSMGRVSKASFSQHTLMELFIANIDNTVTICGPKGRELTPLTDWKNVSFNFSEEVTHIDWEWKRLSGSIALEWLPSTLVMLKINVNMLSGTLDLTSLPPTLIHLDLGQNSFSGEISLTNLPEEMEGLDVSGNSLSGPLDLTKLPPRINTCYLHKNAFSGKTDFGQLPRTLRTLYVSDTDLQGDIYCTGWHFFMVQNSMVRLHVQDGGTV